ncbi:MAG: hypothetical protein JRI35_03865 [Deltaproteobacteria bacterium]|nr:hypothetical protein [Deltaproteobacteria bacterium]MBW1966540.1 hypothetical protein [Deltaproteobacteria bacterium]MBW2097896.1 hypothetical protein [Deltaproteobacteria bacterium]RLB89833.1 MAG: hypothetical protein DRH50_13185 [Deltaproteobacteria bacterium]
MVTIESALQVLKRCGGDLDMDSGKLIIPSEVLGKEDVKKAVHVLKEAGPDKVRAIQKRPYINNHGALAIPLNSDPKFHWWAGGQNIIEILRELKAAPEVIASYVPGGLA